LGDELLVEVLPALLTVDFMSRTFMQLFL
jgi:hypothetical protein